MLKKAWITPNEEVDINTLTLESETVNPEYMRLRVVESIHPAVPTPTRPLRHAIILSSFSTEDLILLHNVISNFIQSR